MSRWFRFYDSVLDDPRCQMLPADEFRAAFFAAIAGEPSPFSCFLIPYSGRPAAAEWAETRSRIFKRDKFTCTYCGEVGKRLECDHVVPVSRGGSSDDNNLTTACKPCNRSKAGKLLSEWRQ